MNINFKPTGHCYHSFNYIWTGYQALCSFGFLTIILLCQFISNSKITTQILGQKHHKCSPREATDQMMVLTTQRGEKGGNSVGQMQKCPLPTKCPLQIQGGTLEQHQKMLVKNWNFERKKIGFTGYLNFEKEKIGFTGYLQWSHGLSARRARRTKSRGPKGLQLEVTVRS